LVNRVKSHVNLFGFRDCCIQGFLEHGVYSSLDKIGFFIQFRENFVGRILKRDAISVKLQRCKKSDYGNK